jgi:hypothetical protein
MHEHLKNSLYNLNRNLEIVHRGQLIKKFWEFFLVMWDRSLGLKS